MFWHGGFPLFVLAYALLFRRQADALAGSLGVAVAVAVSAVVVLVVVLTLLATAGHDLLPIVMRGDDYSLNISKGFTPALWVMTAAVLLVLWLRSIPTVLELWLMVVMFAWLLDIAFSAVFGSQRYNFACTRGGFTA